MYIGLFFYVLDIIFINVLITSYAIYHARFVVIKSSDAPKPPGGLGAVQTAYTDVMCYIERLR